MVFFYVDVACFYETIYEGLFLTSSFLKKRGEVHFNYPEAYYCNHSGFLLLTNTGYYIDKFFQLFRTNIRTVTKAKVKHEPFSMEFSLLSQSPILVCQFPVQLSQTGILKSFHSITRVCCNKESMTTFLSKFPLISVLSTTKVVQTHIYSVFFSHVQGDNLNISQIVENYHIQSHISMLNKYP